MNAHSSLVFFTPFSGSAPVRRRVRGTGNALWRINVEHPRRSLSWGLFFLGVFLLVVAVAGGFVYIREITSTAASGYDVSALERRANDLHEEETRLQLESAELQSLKRIEELVPKLNLVPVQQLAYTAPVLDHAVTGQIPLGTGHP